MENENITQCKLETLIHIRRVQEYLGRLATRLLERGYAHDKSKLESPEIEGFAQAVPIKDLEYGSDDYNASREHLKDTLAHHYANNRHHPEHFPEGIEGMNIVDLVEMLCDWKASSERQNGGNLRMSIEDAAKKFHMSPQLVAILKNSLDLFE